MAAITIPQPYPRIDNVTSKEHGCLDTSALVGHRKKITIEEMTSLIQQAIRKANQKSSRESIAIPLNPTADDLLKSYRKAGRELFSYFRRYCGDPASTAHQVYNKHYRDVGVEQFRNRTLQKERMNSGWRYQFLLLGCAIQSERFKNISDLGTEEADFNAVIEFTASGKESLSLYVSIKNRKNTTGGQDWPKSIRALETIAKNDRNRTGPYCCVFGITMDRGQRYIKREKKTNEPHSVNTEVWLSDFLWPFFANYAYEEMMTLVLDVLLLLQVPDELSTQLEIPDEVLESFGNACQKAGIIDADGYFDDPHRLVKFFCK